MRDFRSGIENGKNIGALRVVQYEPMNDTFSVSLVTNDGIDLLIQYNAHAVDLSEYTGVSEEPEWFVGRTFDIA